MPTKSRNDALRKGRTSQPPRHPLLDTLRHGGKCFGRDRAPQRHAGGADLDEHLDGRLGRPRARPQLPTARRRAAAECRVTPAPTADVHRRTVTNGVFFVSLFPRMRVVGGSDRAFTP